MEAYGREASPTDDELVEKSKKGEVSAFNGLVKRYQKIVYNLALRMLSDPEEADDAAQDAFITAFNKIKHLKGGSFQPWLLRIVANRCIDIIRTRGRRPSVSLDALLEWEKPPPLTDPGESPEEFALRRELRARLQEGLSLLPPDMRLVVILSDVQGYSYEEIANVAATSVGTVRSRLSRGRAKMRDFLSQNMELLPPSLRHK